MDLSDSKAKWKERVNKLKNRILKREVAVFSFFLLLAFVFWFLNALSKEMGGRIEFPVRYINLPEERALVNELPDYLNISVIGPGYSIVQTKLGGRKEHLTIDLNKASIKIQEDRERLRFYILSFSLRELLSSQLRSDFNITSIAPDTIRFEFDRISKRKVPIVADVEVNTQRQYFVHGDIVLNPDSVEISGPNTIVDTIDFVYTKKHLFDQLNKSESRMLGLQTIPKINFSVRRSEITVPVEQFTEVVLELPVTMKNVPDTANIRLFPDHVTMQCIVALSDFNKINDAPLEAFVNLKDIDVMVTNRLKIELDNVPGFVSQVRVNPQYVEYLIEKK